MSYLVCTTKSFDKGIERMKKRGVSMKPLHKVLDILAETGSLPPQYRPHKLSGKWEGVWECYITSDWILLWDQDDEKLTLLLLQTGTHSDLF